MKKIIFLLLIFVFIITGCKKNSVTLDEFIDKAEFNGYIIENNKKGYEEYEDVLDVYYAVNRENAYDIQFLKLKDDDYAKKFFLVNVEDIKTNIEDDNNVYVKSRSLSNYEMYHMENDDNYYIVIRSKANIIYIIAPINYINEIEDFLEELDIDY